MRSLPFGRLLVLHGLRLKGFAEPAAVAALWSLDEAEVAVELKELAESGLVRRREGQWAGWSLTVSGRQLAATMVAEELEATGARSAIEEAYRRFLEINPALLEVCTAWQLRTDAEAQTVNDHSDRAYDTTVVGQLACLHTQARPVLAHLSAALRRFERYPQRLTNALEQVERGAAEWFTKPMIDSYHTVWFELHEDLMATLGLQRGDEGRGSA